MSQEVIDAVRKRDIRAKALHQAAREKSEDGGKPERTNVQVEPKAATWFEKFKSRLGL